MTDNKTTNRSDALRAGRFILAVAADDEAQITEVLKEAAQQDRGVFNLCLELAATTIGIAEANVPDWRIILNDSLLGIDLDDTKVCEDGE